MSNAILEKITIADPITSTQSTRDIGSEAQNVIISYADSSKTQVIEDITQGIVASTGGLSEALAGDINKLNSKADNTALANIVDLDENGKVPASELPDEIDDVTEGYYKNSDGKFYKEPEYITEIIGQSEKIYVDKNTNSIYRWSGDAFTKIFNSSDINIDDLNNVTISQQVVDGESLVYDSTLQRWVNKMVTMNFITPPEVTNLSFTYNETNQSPTIVKSADFDNYVITTIWKNDVQVQESVDVGTYILKFELKNKNNSLWWYDPDTHRASSTDITYPYVINEAEGSITLEKYSVTLDSELLSDTVNVTEATGEISVTSSDESIATANYSNGVITINSPNEEKGTAIITVNVAADQNHNATSKIINVNANFKINALKFSNDSNFTLTATKHSGGSSSDDLPFWDGILEYSIDEGNTWLEWSGKKLNGTANQPIYLRGIGNTRISGNDRMAIHFSFTGKYCTGNIETLLDYQTVKNGEHPTMAEDCYENMFEGCTSLIQAPELPAITLTKYCYMGMFHGCTSLIQVPELPATTLASSCYRAMFDGCTSLTILPKLSATTLNMYCYLYMFQNCSSIKLSTTQTGEYQYEYRIPINGTGTDGGGATSQMFKNTGGTFTGTPEINTIYYTNHEPI